MMAITVAAGVVLHCCSELEDFLSFMDHQTTGNYADVPPQLPDVALGFPGLQLQPHTDSPSVSNSEGSESIGVDPPNVGLPEFGGSACSLSTAGNAADTAAADTDVLNGLPEDELTGVLEPADTFHKLEYMDIKIEQELDMKMELEPEQSPNGPYPAAAGVNSPSPAAAAATAVSAPSSAAAPLAATNTAMGMPFAAMQPAAAALQGVAPAAVAVTSAASLSQWAAVTASPTGTQQQVALPQVLLIQPGRAQKHQQPAQTQPQKHTRQQAANGSVAMMATASRDAPIIRTAGSAGSGSRSLHRSQSNEGISSGGCKLQISHSTVEKQRRDRLNSLIDELSDIVPPADPKYGNDASSVRRPKHVVLSDTINLLKAMQAKLQIEEAEICTLKQQAAAVVAMAAAQQQHQQGTGSASPTAAGSGQLTEDVPVLPVAPEGCASTGVLVEQGVNCLFVKVNCKDRKGLLADVVSALKAFPVVISTAAITTTRDGTVHDVFEVSGQAQGGC